MKLKIFVIILLLLPMGICSRKQIETDPISKPIPEPTSVPAPTKKPIL